jgi:hypothetical protein
MVDGRADNPGEGFNSSGTPLSGLKKDEYHGKLTGLAAAEKRLAVQKKIGKGGVLGGSSVLGRSMKDVLAEVCLVLVLPFSDSFLSFRNLHVSDTTCGTTAYINHNTCAELTIRRQRDV